jgi:hypothetical protein
MRRDDLTPVKNYMKRFIIEQQHYVRVAC